MINFHFQSPTKVIFGKNTEEMVGYEIRQLGYHKAMVVNYATGSKFENDLLSRVYSSLKEANVDYVPFGGVTPNPLLSLVYKGIDLCRQENVDFLLAVGGGSVIDTAKAIAYGISNDFDVWDLFEQKRTAKGCAPVGVVLTIAATGSETSNSTVITNEDGMLKRPYNDDIGRPKFAIMNPELTYTLPPYQTASGGADIMMHTIERYFTIVPDNELTDRMSEALLITVLNCLPRALHNPCDYDARAQLMWAGSLSHNGLLGTGKEGDFACHMLEHELGGMFNVAHGAGLTAIWGSWARLVYKTNVARFAQFAVRVMGCRMNYFDMEKTALEGIDALENFFQAIGMPTNLRELGIPTLTEEQIVELAEKCTFCGKKQIGHFKVLSNEDIKTIYRMSC